MRFLFALMICSYFSVVVAQDALMPRDEPKVNLRNTAIAKIESIEGTKTIVIKSPEWVDEVRQRDVTVTRTLNEARTRTVTREGKQIEEAYTVKVPVSSVQAQDYTVRILTGKYLPDLIIPVNNATVWKVTGEKLGTDDIEEMLAKATLVVLYNEADYHPDPFYVGVLNPNLLLIRFENKIAGRRRTRVDP